MNYPKNRNSKSRRKNYAGEKIGYIDVIEYIEREENGKEIREYKCFCNACNSTKIIPHNVLRIAKSHAKSEGKSPSCGCMKSLGVKTWNDKNRKDLTNKSFGCLKVLEAGPVITVGTQLKQRRTWKCQCVCGSIVYATTGDLISGNTKSCGCTLSSAEACIAEYLTKRSVKFYREYSFEDLCTEKGNPLRFDFAIIDEDNTVICLIEYQGDQHYKNFGPFGRLQREETDEKKRIYCSKNNLKLFEIPYDHNTEEELDLVLRYVHENTVPSVA